MQDVGDFMDPDYAPMTEAIKKDAASRFEPNMQKILKMAADDIGIHNE